MFCYTMYNMMQLFDLKHLIWMSDWNHDLNHYNVYIFIYIF